MRIRPVIKTVARGAAESKNCSQSSIVGVRLSSPAALPEAMHAGGMVGAFVGLRVGRGVEFRGKFGVTRIGEVLGTGVTELDPPDGGVGAIDARDVGALLVEGGVELDPDGGVGAEVGGGVELATGEEGGLGVFVVEGGVGIAPDGGVVGAEVGGGVGLDTGEDGGVGAFVVEGGVGFDVEVVGRGVGGVGTLVGENGGGVGLAPPKGGVGLGGRAVGRVGRDAEVGDLVGGRIASTSDDSVNSSSRELGKSFMDD